MVKKPGISFKRLISQESVIHRSVLTPEERAEIERHNLIRDYAYMVFGSILLAVALDGFLVPDQLAAGGAAGLATIIYYLGLSVGLYIPIGMQVLVMNALLMIPVYRTGGMRYAARTIFGIVVSSIFIDVLAPFIPHLTSGDILMSALGGAVVSGIGLGLVFRGGGNTGGSDILAQLLARRSPLSVGTWLVIVDVAVVAGSIPLFGFKIALYAALTVGIASWIVDKVIDGPAHERAAFIISTIPNEMSEIIMHELGRGCTLISAQGAWTHKERPMLFVVLSLKEVVRLKEIVATRDRDAIVIITGVHEAYGEGFKEIGVQ